MGIDTEAEMVPGERESLVRERRRNGTDLGGCRGVVAQVVGARRALLARVALELLAAHAGAERQGHAGGDSVEAVEAG